MLQQWLRKAKIWGYLTFVTGPRMDVEFIYAYNGESVRAALGTIGRTRAWPGLTGEKDLSVSVGSSRATEA